MNEQAIYYLNKLIGLGMEAKRLQDECFEKTGVQICGLGAQMRTIQGDFYVQTYESIDKLGLPVQTTEDGEEKFVEINGYRVIEV